MSTCAHASVSLASLRQHVSPPLTSNFGTDFGALCKYSGEGAVRYQHP